MMDSVLLTLFNRKAYNALTHPATELFRSQLFLIFPGGVLKYDEKTILSSMTGMIRPEILSHYFPGEVAHPSAACTNYERIYQ